MLSLSLEAQWQRTAVGGPREYEKKVIEKLKPYSTIPGFDGAWEKPTQWAIDHHCGDNLDGISARVFLDNILEYPDNVFEEKVKGCCDAWVKKHG